MRSAIYTHQTRGGRLHSLDPRFTVAFAGLEEPEDFATRADAFAKLIPLGVVSPATAARLLHLPAPGAQ